MLARIIKIPIIVYVSAHSYSLTVRSMTDIGLIMTLTGLAFINYIVSPSFSVRQRFHLYLHSRSVQPHSPPLLR